MNPYSTQSNGRLHFVLKILALVCMIGPFSCTGDDPCPAMGIPEVPSIIVEVWDYQTGAPILAGVSGVAVTDGKTISFEQDADSMSNALWIYGPRGRYDVFLAKSGYHAWYMADVEVRGTRCYQTYTELKAELVPLMEGQTLPTAANRQRWSSRNDWGISGFPCAEIQDP